MKPACVAGPSCDDGVQNGNEIGVDCGGDCAACPPDGSRVGNVDLGNITGLGSPTGWLAFYTPDQQVELTHIGIDIPSVNGDYQFQCFVYSRDPNVVDDNTFRRDLFDGVIGRTEPVPVGAPATSILPSRPLSFSIPSSMVSGVC